MQKEQWSVARNDWQKAQQLLGKASATTWLAARIEHAQRGTLGSRNNAAEQLVKQFPTSEETNWLRSGEWQKF